MTQPTLHDLARFARNQKLVGEDRAFIAAMAALAGDASVIWRGYSGTGKTVGADICAALVPSELMAQVDMVSKLGIWSKGLQRKIAAARFVYFPEDQNASDNEEVVKVKKKWGDGKPAEREKSADMGEDTELQTLPCRTFLSTAAITNEAHARSFDLESARRVVKVNTDPSEAATRNVLAAQAEALVRGRENVRTLTPGEALRIRRHVAQTLTANHARVQEVRFFGAQEMLSAIPTFFPETRSAYALFQKVLLGVGRWYADSEVCVGSEVFLSPQRVAETWAFYGPIFHENCLKWETSDREILSAFPSPKWVGDAIAPECLRDLDRIMRGLKPHGLTDKALVRRQIGKLAMKGFLEEQTTTRGPRYFKTDLADAANLVDWVAVLAACRKNAKTMLEGEPRARYLALCEEAEGPRGMQNPLTGEWGPIVGEGSVLSFDPQRGYAPVGVKVQAAPQGLAAYGVQA